LLCQNDLCLNQGGASSTGVLGNYDLSAVTLAFV
jgi:hypothetical protein